MIKLIVAHNLNGTIGRNNQIPWKLKADMEHFKNCTKGQTVVMGRKTFESIGKPLPKRINRVLTTQPDLLAGVENIEVFTDDRILDNIETEDVYIIGGEAVYHRFLDKCDELIITLVESTLVGDAFFHESDRIKELGFKVVDAVEIEPDEENSHAATIFTFRKVL